MEKQIQVGDTNTVYAVETVSSPERYDNLSIFYFFGRDDELIKYRRLAW